MIRVMYKTHTKLHIEKTELITNTVTQIMILMESVRTCEKSKKYRMAVKPYEEYI